MRDLNDGPDPLARDAVVAHAWDQAGFARCSGVSQTLNARMAATVNAVEQAITKSSGPFVAAQVRDLPRDQVLSRPRGGSVRLDETPSCPAVLGLTRFDDPQNALPTGEEHAAEELDRPELFEFVDLQTNIVITALEIWELILQLADHVRGHGVKQAVNYRRILFQERVGGAFPVDGAADFAPTISVK